MQAEDLDLVETSILVEALRRRSGAVVVVMVSSLDSLRRRSGAVVVVMVSSLDSEREARECWWRGGLIASLGLAEYAKQRISQQFKEPSLPGE